MVLIFRLAFFTALVDFLSAASANFFESVELFAGHYHGSPHRALAVVVRLVFLKLGDIALPGFSDSKVASSATLFC